MKKATAKKRSLHLFAELVIVLFAVLLLFSLLMSRFFSAVFFKNTYEDELRQRTEEIAAKVQACFSDDAFARAFVAKDIVACQSEMAFLRDYARIDYMDVWVVAGDTVMISYNRDKDALEFDEIPYRYGNMVEHLFSGESVGNQQYNGVWNRDMFGIGTPVTEQDGSVAAAVITQVSNEHVAATTKSANSAVLLSAVVAMLASLVVVALLSGFLTTPLKKMRRVANVWVTEDYGVRTQVKRNDEIGELASAMDVLGERLQKLQQERAESEKARYQFFADVSHELKTPVTVLRAQIEMLKDGMLTDPKEVQSCLFDALDETHQLQRLVEDLLTLAKLQSPEFSLAKAPVSLCDVLHDVERSTAAVAAKRNVTLVFCSHCCDETDCTVTGDYTRIRQLLLVFIDNALKFSTAGGKILITMENTSCPTITIADEGSGIDEETLQHVFDRFYTHYDRNNHGTGLGLPIAKQIADRHGASLVMTSKVGVGTTVTIGFLPTGMAEDPPADG